MKNSMRIFLKKHFPRLIYRYLNFRNPDRFSKNKLLSYYNIDTVFDVGANVGMYAHAIRHNGFSGKIVSFEPIEAAYQKLLEFAQGDEKWICEHFALGDEDIETEINVSEDLVSSSIIESKQKLNDIVPATKSVRKEKIEVYRLDSVFDRYASQTDRVFLKIDTQGFEKHVLEGAKESMGSIYGLQLELSLTQLYNDEMLYNEMIDYVEEIGFELKSIEMGWHNLDTGELMQFDGIFYKK